MRNLDTTTNARGNVEMHFDSVTDLARYITHLEENEICGKEVHKDSSKNPASKDWCLDTPFEAAHDIAKKGGNWTEGARQLQSVKLPTVDTEKFVEAMQLELMPQGGSVDIGEFLADSPECFYGIEEQESEKHIIRIVACVVCSANVQADEMLNRGRAILSLVDELERAGNSVELVAYMPFLSHTETDISLETYTTIKQAGEPWTPAAAAFALAHPAFSRRLGFRLLESSDKAGYLTSYGYGGGSVKQPEADMFFGYVTGGDNYSNPRKALAHILFEAEG